MLRDVAALVVIANTMAVALGFMFRRHRQSRRSANLEHIEQLERENKLIDEAIDRMRSPDDLHRSC